MPHRLITTTGELETFCKACSDVPYITVDTEFLREKTYYSKLCLIQIGAPAHAGRECVQVGIDPLSDDLNLAPLEELFFNPDIVKVFHAARQDLEIMAQLFDGRIPAPLFDTQVAAMVCGYGDQIGYQNLVKRICHVSLDKSNQYTDWSRRPLSADQIDYALGDVTYLRDIYEHLRQDLDEKNRWSWVAEDVKALEDPQTHVIDPNDVWMRVKIRSDKPKNLVALKALAAWREREAMEKDRPRNFIIRDEVLSELARQLPKREKDLEKIRGIPEKYRGGTRAKMLLEIIESALNTPKNSWPERATRNTLPPEFIPAQEMLKMLLKIQAAAHGVVPRVIAGGDDLDDFLMAEDPSTSPIMKGWRYEIFGKQAEAMLTGKLALKLEDNKIIQQFL